MTDTYKTLYQGQVPASGTILYIVGAGKSTIIKHWTAVNLLPAGCSIRMWKNGVTDPYAIMPTITIPMSGYAEWDGTMAMAAGEWIAAQAGTINAITVTLDGDEVT
jgi:hypothetical protein